ncbi:hypothetical protein LguiA_024892 [Lonicera macranthoides]
MTYLVRRITMVNGCTCMDAKLAQPDQFFTSRLHIPRNSSNKFGSVVSPITVSQVPELNTLGIALARIDYTPWGVVPHTCTLVPPRF